MHSRAVEWPAQARRWLLALALIVMVILALLSPLRSGAKIWGDVGDAPDSSNHHGQGMTAYPWATTKAAFPTVFDPWLAGNIPGPIHMNPLGDAWLGKHATSEADADLGSDEDGVDNINPPANQANKDGYDDGVIFPASPQGLLLPSCAKTAFKYVVTAPRLTMGHPMIVNVWYDFNRDGDWNDTLTCQTSPSGPVIKVPEWAVQNQVISVVSGSQTLSTPSFMSFHPGGHRNIWMRITLSEGKAALPASGPADGRGPKEGFRSGETEDYYLSHCQICTGAAYYGGP